MAKPKKSVSVDSVGHELYSHLFEMSSEGVVIQDEKGTILDVNPAFCELMKYKREELIGQKVHIVTHPDIRHQVDGNIKKILKP